MDFSQYPTTWVLLFVGVVTLFIAVMSYGSRRKEMANLPPGPRDLPIIGALLEMEPRFNKVLNKFAVKYGPVAFFRLGVQNLVVVSSAEAAEELLKQKDAEFSDRTVPMSRSASKYTGFNGGLFPFSDYSAEFKLLRKISTTEFFTIAKIKSYEKLRTQETAVMVKKIFSVIESSKENGDQDNSNGVAPMGIRSIFLGEVMNILFSLCLGKRFDSLAPTDPLREFPEMVDELLDIFMSPNLVDLLPWLTWLDPQGLLKRMKSLGKRQDHFYKMIIDSNRQELKRKSESGTSNDHADEASSSNFVHVLLRAQEEGAKISDDGISGTIVSMMAGGSDTSTHQLEWVLLEIARHPKVQQRLQDELDVVVGKERPLEEADIQALPFLNAVILETMRLHGVAPFTFPHVNMEPSTLCGYNIPAKTGVIVNSFIIGRDPKMWKDPLKFSPDRFMASGSSLDNKLSPTTIKASGSNFNLLPFSSGRRVCPGYNLGMMLLLRTIGSLVHAFNWSPPPGCAPEDLSIEDQGSFLVCPSPEPHLVPTPRLSSNVYKSNIICP